jgi:hypothetical protein
LEQDGSKNDAAFILTKSLWNPVALFSSWTSWSFVAFVTIWLQRSPRIHKEHKVALLHILHPFTQVSQCR